MKNIKKRKAELILLLGTVVWGFSFPITKALLENLQSFQLLAIRFLIASAVLIIVFHKHIKFKKEIMIPGVILAIFISAALYLQTVGMIYTSATNSAFITCLAVILVPFFERFIFKNKIHIDAYIGCLVVLMGLMLLSGGLNLAFNIGDFYSLLCAIIFAFQLIYIDRSTKKGNAVSILIVEMSVSAIIFTVCALLFEGVPNIMNVEIIGFLLFAGILCTAFSYGVQTVFQKNTTTTNAGIIYSTEPLFALLLVVIVPSFGGLSVLTVASICGALLVVFGMIVAQLEPVKKIKIRRGLVNE